MKIKIANIIEESFGVLITNRAALLFALVGAIFGAAIFYAFPSASYISSIAESAAPTSGAQILNLFIIIVLSVLVTTFFSAALISAVYQTGESNLGKLARKALSRYGALLGVNILIFLAVALLTLIPITVVAYLLVPTILAMQAQPTAAPIGMLLLSLVLIFVFEIAGAYAAIKLSIAPAEAVAGGKPAGEALSSSWSATRGNFFGILLVYAAIAFVYLTSDYTFALISPVLGAFVGAFLAYAYSAAQVLMYKRLEEHRAAV